MTGVNGIIRKIKGVIFHVIYEVYRPASAGPRAALKDAYEIRFAASAACACYAAPRFQPRRDRQVSAALVLSFYHCGLL
jgi:hypothetical protein